MLRSCEILAQLLGGTRPGLDAARDVSAAMYDTFAEIERVIGAEKIDAQWARGGTLRLARGEHEIVLREALRDDARAGERLPARLQDPADDLLGDLEHEIVLHRPGLDLDVDVEDETPAAPAGRTSNSIMFGRSRATVGNPSMRY
ncbi:MAG: hypothetical protein HC806_08735 [Anaerolineae bacterium]|nr:hypothetical protein [Anaerolineae bacterium]